MKKRIDKITEEVMESVAKSKGYLDYRNACLLYSKCKPLQNQPFQTDIRAGVSKRMALDFVQWLMDKHDDKEFKYKYDAGKVYDQFAEEII